MNKLIKIKKGYNKVDWSPAYEFALNSLGNFEKEMRKLKVYGNTSIKLQCLKVSDELFELVDLIREESEKDEKKY